MDPAQKVPQVVSEISATIGAHFGENLLSVLLYGNSKTQKTFWDFDVLIILKEKTSPSSDYLVKVYEQN